MPGDRDDLEQPPFIFAEEGDALAEEIVEARRALLRRSCLARGKRAPGELLREERASVSFEGDHPREAGAHRPLPLEQHLCQLLRLSGAERLERELADVVTGPRVVPLLEQRDEQGARALIVGAIASNEQNRRRWGREEIDQQRGAVGVAPLDVIDEQRERSAGGEPAEELAQRAERTLPEHLAIGDRERWRRAGGDHRHAVQHGKDLRKERNIRRDQRLCLRGRDLREVLRQPIDDAVQRLEGYRLVLVAAPREDQQPLAPRELCKGSLDQGALAEARRSVHQHSDRPPRPQRLEGPSELGELPGAPHERATTGRRGDLGDRRAPLAQALENLRGLRPLRGGAAQELHAELVEVFGDARRARGPRRVARSLGLEDLADLAPEGQGPGQRFVEQDAERIPIDGRRQWHGQQLLRRHVPDRAGHLALHAGAKGVGGDLRDQPEIEDHDPSFRGHQDVRRLDVAMELLGEVQGVEAACELDRGRTQACHRLGIEGACPGARHRGSRSPPRLALRAARRSSSSVIPARSARRLHSV